MDIQKKINEFFVSNKIQILIYTRKFDEIDNHIKKLEKESYKYNYLLALRYFYESNFTKSLEYFEKMLKKKNVKYNYQFFFINNIFGRYRANKEYENIIHWYYKIIELTNNDKIKIALHEYTAQAYYEKKDYEKSLSILESAKKINPKTIGLQDRIDFVNTPSRKKH